MLSVFAGGGRFEKEKERKSIAIRFSFAFSFSFALLEALESVFSIRHGSHVMKNMLKFAVFVLFTDTSPHPP